MIKFRLLEGRVQNGGVTFGVPHFKGEISDSNNLIVEQGESVLLSQNKPIAFWEDGSVKWSAVSVVPGDGEVTVRQGFGIKADNMPVTETVESITVDNGCFKAVFYKKGNVLMETDSFSVGLKAVKTLVTKEKDVTIKKEITYHGEITECMTEETGSVKTVICLKGAHKAEDSFLPFILRVTLYKNSPKADIVHTFIYDGDAVKDFIGGIGVCVKHKMKGNCANRRVKIAGDSGIFHEPLKMLTTWRPRIKREYYMAQLRGESIDVLNIYDERGQKVSDEVIDNVTVWDCYKYTQVTPDSFKITKRTAHEECAYINAGFGKRANGLLYAGDEKGGIAVAMRHFYEKAPSAIWAEKLSEDEAEITAWIHPADSEALDLRHYDTVSHDQTYYEGFPYLDSDPYGIACTNELSVFVYGETPEDDKLLSDAESVARPAVYVTDSETYKNTNVLGTFSLPDKSTPFKAWLEEELDKAVDFYIEEVEKRHWYGLFDYGDVMHTYDAIRHSWKYDMGGYAWQNTELVPTLWLWYMFLRSGRGDVFSLAEAMSRHTADVDVYHMGAKKGLGSRHNVLHWGDSCKEARIAMAGHHRPLYYIMGSDARIGDVFDDVRDGDMATILTDPLGAFYKKDTMKLPTHARLGPDWSSYCSNWYTEWERKGNTQYRDKIETGVADIRSAPLGMISGPDFEYDPETGHLGYFGENATGGMHLAICMGGPQTWMELADKLSDDKLKNMLAEFGRFYFLSSEEKQKEGKGLKRAGAYSFPYMAAAMGAYAAKEYKDENLAYKVWKELIGALPQGGFDKKMVKYYNNDKLEEIVHISTNFASQWCLNTIVCLELIKEYIPKSLKEHNNEKEI